MSPPPGIPTKPTFVVSGEVAYRPTSLSNRRTESRPVESLSAKGPGPTRAGYTTETRPFAGCSPPPGVASTSVSLSATSCCGAGQAMFNDVLGEFAPPSAIAFWEPLVASQGRASVVQQFVFGQSAMSRDVDAFGRVFWGQETDGDTEQYAVSLLVSGQVTLADMASAFVPKPQYIQRANATVT